MINHICDVTKELFFVPGAILSLDEMIICFFGRLKETLQMKRKHIKEGYKFFILVTKDGFMLILLLTEEWEQKLERKRTMIRLVWE